MIDAGWASSRPACPRRWRNHGCGAHGRTMTSAPASWQADRPNRADMPPRRAGSVRPTSRVRRRGVQMADGDGQRIGDVVRRGLRVRGPSSSLTICCTCGFSARPYPTTARLISAGVYSKTGRPACDGGKHRDASRVAQLQRASHVPRVEDVLDGHAVRPVFGEQCDQPGVDVQQLVGKRAQRAARTAIRR